MNNSVYIKRKTNDNFKLNNVFITVLLVFYVLWRMPIVSYYVNTYVAMMALVSLTVLVAFYDTKYFTKTPSVIVALIPFLLLTIGDQYLMGIQTSNSALNVIWLIFLDIMPVFVGCLIIYNEMDFAIKVLVPTIIASHVITGFTTYLGLLRFPEASRIMATGGTHFERYYVYNIGGFAFVYALVLLHPLFVGYFKLRNKYILSILTTAITGFCVFESAYTTAALLFILSCVAYFLPTKDGKKMNKTRVALIVAFLVVVLIMLPAFLEALSEWEPLERSSEKLKDLAGMLQGKETEGQALESRQEVYQKSWEIFKSSPIIGFGLFGEKTGGHSYFLDTLAKWGLIGFTVIIVFFLSFFNEYKRLSNGSFVYYYALLFFVLLIILCGLNPKIWLYQLGFVVPLFLYHMENKTPVESSKEYTVL